MGRKVFLDLLKTITEDFRWLCHAYCLMANHYPLVVETLEANLSGGIKQLNKVYSMRYNRRHRSLGHVSLRYEVLDADPVDAIPTPSSVRR